MEREYNNNNNNNNGQTGLANLHNWIVVGEKKMSVCVCEYAHAPCVSRLLSILTLMHTHCSP